MTEISDKKFLGYNWPPRMPSYKPKQKRKYKHEVLVVSRTDPDRADVYQFTNEPDARSARNSLRKATNNISVEYEQKEVPQVGEKGYIA